MSFNAWNRPLQVALEEKKNTQHVAPQVKPAPAAAAANLKQAAPAATPIGKNENNTNSTTSDASKISNEVTNIPTNTAANNVASTKPAVSGLAFSINKSLVIDTGAILKGMKLEKYGNRFFTIPEVIDEIRDSKARYILMTLPYKLETRQPTPEAMAAVTRFAKLTGDYGTLSVTDIKVIALAYTLEAELNGTAHLKKQPTKIALKGEFTKGDFRPYGYNENNNDEASEDTTAIKKKKKHKKPETFEEDPVEEEEQQQQQQHDGNKEAYEEEQNGDATEEHADDLQNDEEVEEDGEHQQRDENQNGEEEEEEEADVDGVEQDLSAFGFGDGEDDEADWITPENIEQYKSKSVGASESWNSEASKDRREVGCVTTDFAMQNVLLQMGLQLVSVDGMRITQIRQWVLRCHACGAIVNNTSRKFCPSCGNPTMLRVSCEVDSSGNIVYYFNPKRRINIRGTIFPLPLPRGGRYANDPILREDQLAGVGRKKGIGAVSQKRRNKIIEYLNAPEFRFEDNFVSGSSNSGRRPHGNTLWNGYGRKNPNEVRANGKARRKRV